MRTHPKDNAVAILDDMSEASQLAPVFNGAVFRSPELVNLAKDFDGEEIGVHLLKRVYHGKREGKPIFRVNDFSANVMNGKVQEPRYRISGVKTFKASFLLRKQNVRELFQSFADIITPAFGNDYNIRLEDRSRLKIFHTDPDFMIAILGLDKDFTPTLWQNGEEELQDDPCSLMIVLPKLLHSSPDVPNRPTLSAAKHLSPD